METELLKLSMAFRGLSDEDVEDEVEKDDADLEDGDDLDGDDDAPVKSTGNDDDGVVPEE